jgi:hypothetical protein
MKLTLLCAFQQSCRSVASPHVEGIRLHDQEQPAKHPLMPVTAISRHIFLYFYFIPLVFKQNAHEMVVQRSVRVWLAVNLTG